jgi:hypothetical protein
LLARHVAAGQVSSKIFLTQPQERRLHMGLLGSVLGFLGAGQSSGQIASQYGNAENGVLGATQNGQQSINNSLANTTSNLNNAGAAAIAGVNNATTTANAGINAGVSAANGTLATTLANQNANLAPYLATGAAGAAGLTKLANNPNQFSFTPGDLTQDPGYQFQLSQGQSAITNQAAASGLAQGGNTLKALTQFGQGLAGTTYQQAFDRANTTFNTNQNATLADLTSAAGVGLNASNQFNTAAMNAGNGTAANITAGAGAVANNTLNDALYAGNTNTSLQEYLGTLGLQGSEFGANLGLTGATTAGNFGVGKGVAQAGGTAAQTNQLTSGLGTLGSLLAALGV